MKVARESRHQRGHRASATQLNPNLAALLRIAGGGGGGTAMRLPPGQAPFLSVPWSTEKTASQTLNDLAMAGAAGAATYFGAKAGEALLSRFSRPANVAAAEPSLAEPYPPSLAPASYQGSMRAPMSYQGSLGVRSEYGSTVDLGDGTAGIRGPRPFGEMSSSGAPSIIPSEAGFESARGSSLMDTNGRMSEWLDSLPSSRASSVSDTLSSRASVLSGSTDTTIPRATVRSAVASRPMTRLPRNWLDPQGPSISEDSTIASSRFTPSEAERQVFGPEGNPAFQQQSIISQRPVFEPPAQEMTTISRTDYNATRQSVMAEEEGNIARGSKIPTFEESQAMMTGDKTLAEVRTASRMKNLQPLTGREGLQRLGRRGVSNFDQFQRPTGFRSQMPTESRALNYSAPRTIPMAESVGGVSNSVEMTAVNSVEMTPIATQIGGGVEAAAAESAAADSAFSAETVAASSAAEVGGLAELGELGDIAAVAVL